MNEQPIITLTNGAAAHIAAILDRHKNNAGFRLSVKKTGCSGYMYAPEVIDQQSKDDVRIDTQQGITVFVDNKWTAVLSGTVIDLVVEDLGQKKLVYKNPNVDDECGCGESFNIKE